MSIASTVDQSSSSMKGKLPIPGCAGCNPASQTTFFPLCSMTQHDLPTSCPAPSIVIVKGGVSSPPLMTWTGAERWSCRRGCRRMAPRYQVCYLFCRVQGESRMEGWTTIDPEFLRWRWLGMSLKPEKLHSSPPLYTLKPVMSLQVIQLL